METPWGWSELSCQKSSQDVTVARAEKMGLWGHRMVGNEVREADRISRLGWGLAFTFSVMFYKRTMNVILPSLALQFPRGVGIGVQN